MPHTNVYDRNASRRARRLALKNGVMRKSPKVPVPDPEDYSLPNADCRIGP